MNKILEQQAVQSKWVPKIRKALNEKGKNVSESRLQIIAKMAHSRAILENAGYATPGNTPGRGGIAFGNNPNGGNSSFYGPGSQGSAEAWQNLFGVFLEVAAANIAMELVPVIPATKSSGIFYIAEPIYGGGKLDSSEKTPDVIQVKLSKNGNMADFTTANEGETFTVVETGGDSIMELVYMGKHRINANAVFRVGKRFDNSGAGGENYNEASIAEALDSTSNGARIVGTAPADYFTFVTGSIDLVSGFTNYVNGYSGAGTNDTDDWFLNRADGKKYTKPMSRQTGENSYARTMGVRTWHKNYAADTIKTKISLTNEQVQDMQNDLGISADEFSDMVITDQLNQHINGHILGRLFALGWDHHYSLHKLSNGKFNLNAFLGSSSASGAAQTFLGKDDTLKTIAGPSGALPSTGAISENLSTLQRRIVTRMLYASGVIKSRSRRGKADQGVLNTTFATAIKDIRGFQPAPFDNNVDSNTDLELIGSLYGMKIYEDGLMDFGDERINISRKGNEKDPGIKMLPYVLAEKITTVSEAGMNPTKMLMSRYSLVEAGTAPELNQLTFTVESGANGYSIV